MAKHSVARAPSRIRFIMVDAELGDGDVGQITQAIQNALRPPAATVIKRIPAAPTNSAQVDATGPAEDVLDEDDVNEVPSESETNGNRRPRGSGPKVDRNAGISLVHDLNFRPDGRSTLREFFEQKAPRNDMEEILVAVHYMEHTMRVPKIGLGHIRTALHDVGKSIPRDLRQTVYNMRSKKAWVKFADVDAITMATAGDNHVLHDMGKKG